MNDHSISNHSSSLTHFVLPEGETSIQSATKIVKDSQVSVRAQAMDAFAGAQEEHKQELPGQYLPGDPLRLQLWNQTDGADPYNSRVEMSTLHRSSRRENEFDSHMERRNQEPVVVVHAKTHQVAQVPQAGLLSRARTSCQGFFRRCFGGAAR